MSGCRVFLGGLSSRAYDGDVERFFQGFGKIRDIKLKQGYGFVEFDDHRDAEDAVYEMNNKTLCGSRVTVEHAKGTPKGSDGGGGWNSSRSGDGYGGRDRGGYGDRDRYGGRDDHGYNGGRSFGGGSRYPAPSRTKYRMVVENMSSRVTWQDLKDHFRQAGEVTYAEANQKARNKGVVDFATYDDMKTAIRKMDGTELYGRKMKLSEEGGSMSRSRSRSPIRSRSSDRGRKDSKKSRSPSRLSKTPDRHYDSDRSYSMSPLRD